MDILTGDALNKAVARFESRMKVFMDEGLSKDEAYELADSMFVRDHHNHPHDDRRICFECENYNTKTKKCSKILDHLKKPSIPLRFILMRCEHFLLKGSK
jgi:hypothetical protein